MSCNDLLIEIGTEELPPRALKNLSAALRDELCQQFTVAGLQCKDTRVYATSRRLAVVIQDLVDRQPDQITIRRGPAVPAAFDADGMPTKAALGFAKSCGVEVRELERIKTEAGDWLVFQSVQTGQPTVNLIPDVLSSALRALPIPKRMRWGAGEVEFVRPIHWICVLYGEHQVPGRVFGVDLGGETRGHRFHAPDPVRLGKVADYAQWLREHGKVEPDFETRRQAIVRQVTELATSVGGLAWIDPEVTDEVTALCEWPIALLGRFDVEFLQVPREVLIETMQKNQKYFPLLGKDQRLLPYFITISNIESRDPEMVRSGNERVIRPRFSDARFFWNQDIKTPIGNLRPRLEQVVFQESLGSVWDRSLRVSAIAREIARELSLPAELAGRAAELSKCDLVTLMVGEFGGLQGIIGRYYAEQAGEHPDVALAIEEHYLPRHAGDRLPSHDLGRCLALADRLETLVGAFAIGQRPTGVKDPYGLRRAAIGVSRLLIEAPLDLDLRQLLYSAATTFPNVIGADRVADEVFVYCKERLSRYFAERGLAADCVDAVMDLNLGRPADIERRIRAIETFKQLPEATDLAAANKRISNLLKKANWTGDETMPHADEFTERSEIDLFKRLQSAKALALPLIEIGDYSAALVELAQLRDAVDGFFTDVMVLTDDADKRRARLGLLTDMRQLFLAIADVSRLEF